MLLWDTTHYFTTAIYFLRRKQKKGSHSTKKQKTLAAESTNSEKGVFGLVLGEKVFSFQHL